MVALMYAETRLTGVSRLDFLARWRLHGALALDTPRFRSAVLRYVHRDPLLDVSQFPGADSRYDALGEIVCADPETLSALLQSPEMNQTIRGDGASTFARTRTVNAIVEERHLRDEYVAPVAISEFLSPSPDATDLAERVAGVHEQLLAMSGPLDALCRRVSVSPATDPRAAWGVFVDLGFDSVDDAAAAYAEWSLPTQEAYHDQVRDRVVIVSVRCPLYDPGALLG